MPLNLTPEDQAEYDRRSKINFAAKEAAMAAGDRVAARHARQDQSHLYTFYSARQIPVDPATLSPWEREQNMTVEERLDRIEQHLSLGMYEDCYE